MNRFAKRVELALSLAVVVIAAVFWAISWAISDPPEFSPQYFLSAILVTLLGAPWVVAVRLLWRAWWDRYGSAVTGMDGPSMVLAAAVATLPEDRSDWGRAMLTELSHVDDVSSRWSFATGCALTAVFPPQSNRLPVLLVGVLAAAAAAAGALAVGQVIPGLFVFAAVFLSMVGVMTTLAMARSHRASMPGATLSTGLIGVGGVVASVAAVAWFLTEHRTAAEHLSSIGAVVLAVALAGSLWLAVRPPRLLTAGGSGGRIGAGAALFFAFGFFVTSRLFIETSGGTIVWIIIAPWVVTFAAAATAAARGHSFRAGIQAAVWTALLSTVLVFAITLPEASYRYAADGGLLMDGDGGVPVGVNLTDAVWILIMLPIQALPFGVMGASFGARGSLREIGIKTPSSPGLASVLLCLPFAVLFTIATNDVEPFKTWFSQGHPLAPLSQLLLAVSFVCVLLAALFAVISVFRNMSKVMSAVR